MIIKIRFGDQEEVFESKTEMLKFLSETVTNGSLDFQRLTYENGELSKMDYLTYEDGRVSSTFNTRY